MKKVRSLIIALASAILIAFMMTSVIPLFSVNVNADDDVIEVSTPGEMISAAGSYDNTGKTIRLTQGLENCDSLTIHTSIILDLNGYSIKFKDNERIYIDTVKEDDTVIIRGCDNDYIYGSNKGYLVEMIKGKLICVSVFLDNGCKTSGSCFNSSSDILLCSGIYNSFSEMGEDIQIPLSTVSVDEGTNYFQYNLNSCGLTIDGTGVTYDNCNDILNNGVFSYDIWTKTLFIKDDYSSDIQKCSYRFFIDDVTVNISNDVEIDGYFYISGDTTITGNNRLTLNTDETFIAFYSGNFSSLTIKDVSLVVNAGTFIMSADDLLIDNAEIISNTSNFFISYYSDLKSLELKDCNIYEPEGSYIYENYIYYENGDPASYINIRPDDCWKEADYSWSDDNTSCTAKREYIYDSSISETETVTSISKVKTPATTSSMGTTTYTAAFDNKAFETQTKDVQDIPVLQNDDTLDEWKKTEYTWSDDYSKCTAKRENINDSSIVETETVTSVSTVKIPATTSSKGTTTYTATFVNEDFETQTIDVQDIPFVQNPDPIVPTTDTNDIPFSDFVERLYVVVLGRASEPEGKAFWSKHVDNGDLNGAQCAKEFLLSQEFKNRELSDEQFLEVLYSVFFDRKASEDPKGFDFWMNSLKTEGRDKVIDGFINSTEWCNVCAAYGVKSGATGAKATIASEKAIKYATRLYTECLGRDPDEEGLKFWSFGLTNLELTGSHAAHEFFFSKEFNDHNYSDKELLTRMYRAFMGREPDDDGMNFWLDSMKNGMTKEQVFDEFVKSPEFTQICKDYAIDRG